MTRPTDALAEHRDELIQLLREHGVASAAIFGSTVTGTDTELSDLDIAVCFEPRPRGFAFYGAIADLEANASRLLGVDVDIVTCRTPEFGNWSGPERVLF